MSRNEAYHDDLAYIHDSGYGATARAAATFLLSQLREGGVRQGRVVDLGCGSGHLSQPVADAGYDVFGVDISGPMLQIARQRVPGGEFRQGSVLQTDIPPCVAVAAVGEVSNHLFDRGNRAGAIRKVFRRIHRALAPGGILLFDVAGPGRYPGRGVRKLHAEGPDWAVLVDAEEDRKRGLLTRRITSFRKVGEL